MSTLAPLIEAWDEAYREFAISLEGLSDEDLWKRPHPRLLSVGELAGHIAYGQMVWTLGGGHYRPDLTLIPIKSPFLDHSFGYYPHTVDHPVQLDLTTAQVLEEVTRIHEAVKAVVAQKGKDDPYPGQWQTWGNLIQYKVFHVAYHTGQIYSARHLMGHETEDN